MAQQRSQSGADRLSRVSSAAPGGLVVGTVSYLTYFGGVCSTLLLGGLQVAGRSAWSGGPDRLGAGFVLGALLSLFCHSR